MGAFVRQRYWLGCASPPVRLTGHVILKLGEITGKAYVGLMLYKFPACQVAERCINIHGAVIGANLHKIVVLEEWMT